MIGIYAVVSAVASLIELYSGEKTAFAVFLVGSWILQAMDDRIKN